MNEARAARAQGAPGSRRCGPDGRSVASTGDCRCRVDRLAGDRHRAGRRSRRDRRADRMAAHACAPIRRAPSSGGRPNSDRRVSRCGRPRRRRAPSDTPHTPRASRSRGAAERSFFSLSAAPVKSVRMPNHRRRRTAACKGRQPYMTAIARTGGVSREHTRVPRRAANRRGWLKRMHARPVTVVHSRNGEEAKSEWDERRTSACSRTPVRTAGEMACRARARSSRALALIDSLTRSKAAADSAPSASADSTARCPPRAVA